MGTYYHVLSYQLFSYVRVRVRMRVRVIVS